MPNMPTFEGDFAPPDGPVRVVVARFNGAGHRVAARPAAAMLRAARRR